RGLITLRGWIIVIAAGAGTVTNCVFTTSTLKGPLVKFYVPNGFKCTVGFNELNVAVQFLSTDNVTCAVVPTPAALQSPPHPPKVDPVSGSSVSCTGGIGANGAL